MDANDPLETLIPWNAEASNVQTTESGLQYIVIKEGEDGGKTPGPMDRVSVMYDGRLNDGQVFDSSYARGSSATFGVGQVIKGWTEGLQLMSEGDEYVFYIPSELGYGQNPRPGGVIKPGDDLVFRVELQQVVEAPKPREVDTAAWETYTPWDSSREGIQKTESGLEYVVLAEGKEGTSSPNPTDMVVVYYEGRFADTGEIFDSAFKRGEAAMFPANGVIPGWVEALSMMTPGERWIVHIPADLAYGAQGYGPIPPNAALDFEVELMDIVPVQ